MSSDQASTLNASPARPAGKTKKNWFKSDDPEAEIPQHNFRQGPDFRASSNPESGYAVWGSNRCAHERHVSGA